MKPPRLDCVFLGLSITSTWGNGHATTYRSLLKELAKHGHRVTFLERDVPWYASNREFDELPYCAVHLYSSLDELKQRFTSLVHSADIVVVGSYVPDGIAVGEWVNATANHAAAFYDIDTPVTLAALERGTCEYLSRELCSRYDLYFSFTGGPTLQFIERHLGAACARALYCSVDPALYYPDPQPARWDLAYLGTYAADRQPVLDKLLLKTAAAHVNHAFAVAGPQYPSEIDWPENVKRIEHLPATDHRRFYNSQRFTLNVTRRDMARAGFSPSVRLFEAAACGVPILTDVWPGLESFFEPSSEILLVRSSADVASHLRMTEQTRLEVAARALQRTLRFHTAAVRAKEFETEVLACLERMSCAQKASSIAARRTQTAALL